MRSSLLAGIFLISLILVCAVGVVFLVRSTATSSPIEAVPRQTSLLVRVPNPSELWRGLSGTALAASGETTPAAAIEAFSSYLQSRGITLPAGAATYLTTWQREVLLALVPGDANTPSALVLVVDLGAASHGFPRHVQQLRHAATQAAGTAPPAEGQASARSHRGREYLTLRTEGGNLHVAGAKGLGILATTGAAMRSVLDTLDNRAEPLGSNPAYRATRDRLSRKASVLGWVSGTWAADRLEGIYPGTSGRRVLRLLGLASLRGIGLEVDIKDGLFRERLFAAMDSAGRGLPAELMTGAVHPHRASHLVPAVFPYYLSVSCSNLDAVYRRLPEILASATGGNRRELRARFEGAERFMALDLASGLFAALGDDMVIGFGRSSPWPRGEASRELLQMPAVASISVANRSTIAALLERVDGLARALAGYETIDKGDRILTSYTLAALAPLRPSYRLTSGRLLAASSPELLASALDAGTRRESWADLPGIEDLLARLPDRSHAMMIASSAGVIDLLEVRGRWPRFASMNETLPPIAMTARMTSSGLLLDTVAPVSPSLLVSLALAARDEGRGQTDGPRQFFVEEPIPY